MILIAENDDASRTLLCAGLRERGYVPITAMTEFTARLVLQVERPTFAVVDGELPGEKKQYAGLDVALDCVLAAIPCVLVTGRVDVYAQAAQIGRPVVKMKPYSMADILSVLETCLER